MGRVLNRLKDMLGFNRGKVKATLYTKEGEEKDIRAKIYKGKLEIREIGKEGSIELNPDVVGNPLWDKGPRYIVFEGIEETLNPAQVVADGVGSITRQQKLSNSDSFNRGRRFERGFLDSQKNDMLKYLLYGMLGLAALIVIVNIFVYQQFEAAAGVNETILANLDSIKAAVVPGG